MQIKTIEIRDKGTFIPAFAIRPGVRSGGEAFLWARAGYGQTPSSYILLFRLHELDGHYTSRDWGGRTMPVAHRYLEEHWEDVQSGDVVDVEFILGETPGKKFSESYDEIPF